MKNLNCSFSENTDAPSHKKLPVSALPGESPQNKSVFQILVCVYFLGLTLICYFIVRQ